MEAYQPIYDAVRSKLIDRVEKAEAVLTACVTTTLLGADAAGPILHAEGHA